MIPLHSNQQQFKERFTMKRLILLSILFVVFSLAAAAQVRDTTIAPPTKEQQFRTELQQRSQEIISVLGNLRKLNLQSSLASYIDNVNSYQQLADRIDQLNAYLEGAKDKAGENPKEEKEKKVKK